MKFLDLGQYKKTGIDEKFATFDHPKGHKIQVFMNGLSKLQQEQLKRLPLAKGGEVREPEDEDSPPAAKARTAMKRERSPDQPKDGAGRKYFDEGTPDQPVQSDDDQNPAPSIAHTPITINVNGQPAQAQSAPTPPLQVEPVPQTPPAPAAPSGSPLEQQAQNTLSANAQQQQSVAEQQQIDTTKAQAQVPIEEQQIENAKTIQARQEQTVNELKQHTQDFSDYIKANPVNAQAYAMSQSESQRTNTAIGLALGGFGSALTGGSNQALDFLNKQIDRSIEAQKENINNQNTVFGAYQHLYKDENVSTALTKVSMNDALIHQANLVAANLGTQQAQQARDALQSKLELDNNKLLYDAAGILNGKRASGASPTNELGQPVDVNTGRILNSKAKGIYDTIQYDPTKTPEQKAEIIKQYQNAVQVDRALDQIDTLFPQLAAKATWTGQVAEPFQETLEGLAGHGGIAGAAAGAGAKAVGGAARLIGGNQEVQYKTAKESLRTIVANALTGVHVTPTEAGRIVDQFIPDKLDSRDPATLKDKLEKLKEKVISITKTGALSDAGMSDQR